MEKLFKLSENKTTVRIEIVAGLTTFMTMAYIIALNPNLLTGFDVGSPLWNGVFLATCLASAIGTVTGSLTGTSTITTFIESASGVEAGGRTGLTSLTAGICFLLCMFIAPIAGVIPAAATSSALIYVGVIMLQGLKKIDFDDISQTAPVFLMLIAMPISGSIGHGIGLALIAYVVIKLFTGKKEDISVLTYVLAAIFLVKFFLIV